ncbi:MAG: hypothetical protein KKB20_04865 [Proteobacteria bacterium]|nr:hypothetical protein [Pseudomonadota bacterium]
MRDWNELKNDREVLRRIDWDLTPQEAYEAYQLKSINAWKYRSLPETLYFCIFVWQGHSRLMLIKRSLKQSEEITEVPAPADLMAAALARQGGDDPPHGQYAIDEPIRDWLQGEMGL